MFAIFTGNPAIRPDFHLCESVPEWSFAHGIPVPLMQSASNRGSLFAPWVRRQKNGGDCCTGKRGNRLWRPPAKGNAPSWSPSVPSWYTFFFTANVVGSWHL